MPTTAEATAKKGVEVFRKISAGSKTAQQLDRLRQLRSQEATAQATLEYRREGRVLEMARMKDLARHRNVLERQGAARVQLSRDAARTRAQDTAYEQTMEQIKLLPNEHDRLMAAVNLNVKTGRQTEKWGAEAQKLIEKDRKFVQKQDDEKKRSALLARFTGADPIEKRAVIDEGIVSGVVDAETLQQWRQVAEESARQAAQPSRAEVRTSRMDELRRTGNALKTVFRRIITNASPRKTAAVGLDAALLNDLAAGAMFAAQERYGDAVTPAQILQTAQSFLRENWDWIYVRANTVKRAYGGVDVPKGDVPALPPGIWGGERVRRLEKPERSGYGRHIRSAIGEEGQFNVGTYTDEQGRMQFGFEKPWEGEGVPSGPTGEPGADPRDPLGWR